MKYKLFGKSGLRVSEICLGTMTFGEEFGWGATKEASRKVFDLYVEAGGNFLDTANYYTKGTSEIMVGEFIRQQRERFVVATKYSLSLNPRDPNAGGNHRKNMVQALEASLRRLKVDYIDLYWMHAWDGITPSEEVMRALDDMIRAGKILYIGVSDTPAWVISRSNAIAELKGWTPFIGLQLEYSLIERTIEREFIPMAEHLSLGVTAWSPLGMGVLTGKYLKMQAHADARFDINKQWGSSYLGDRNQTIARKVQSIADSIHKSSAQVALNWLKQKKGGIIPIVGAKNEQQLQDNLGCLEFKLTESQIKELDEVSHIDRGFPHEFLERDNIKHLIHGEEFIETHCLRQ